MRERDPRGRRHGGERRYARHDLGVDSRRSERLDLFTAAAEEKRVAALEAHDGLEAPAERDQQLVHLGLAQTGAGKAESAGGRLVEQLDRRQLVVDDRVRAPEQVEAPHGDEIGVAGTRADEVDRHSSFSTSCSKNTRRSSYVA